MFFFTMFSKINKHINKTGFLIVSGVILSLFIYGWIVLKLFFQGYEYHFQIPELNIEIIEIRSLMAKKQLFVFNSLSSSNKNSDYIIFNTIDNLLDIYIDTTDSRTLYIDRNKPEPDRIEMNHQEFKFVFGELHKDTSMRNLLKEPTYLGIRNNVSKIELSFDFHPRCVYSYHIKDSDIPNRFDSSFKYKWERLLSKKSYKNERLSEEIYYVYRKKPFFITKNKIENKLQELEITQKLFNNYINN